MEHLLLSATTIGSKELAIGSARLLDKLFVNAKQVRSSIDRRVNGDWGFSFGGQKSGNEMSVDFGNNADDEIGMNPLRTIGSPWPQNTSTRLRNYNIFKFFSIPSYIYYRVSEWHSAIKSESENLRDNFF